MGVKIFCSGLMLVDCNQETICLFSLTLGKNFNYYSQGITFIAVDPNIHVEKIFRRSLEEVRRSLARDS